MEKPRKISKAFLLQTAITATEKNQLEEKRYAKNRKSNKLKNTSVQKMADGSYLIPDTMKGKAFSNYLNNKK